MTTLSFATDAFSNWAVAVAAILAVGVALALMTA